MKVLKNINDGAEFEKVSLKENEEEIIKKALIEYEENHYMSEGKKWQETINRLLNKF